MSRRRTVEINTGYEPRELQAYVHKNLKRYNVLVLHRRFGKTVLSINEIIDQGLRCQLHNPVYAYVAPTYKQAKMIAWEYFVDFTRNIPGVSVNKSELSVTIERPGVKVNGIWLKQPDKIKYMLLGADNPDALRGIYLDGSVIDEYAQCNPILWGEIIRPALSDRKGWVIFIGTPKGENHFKDRYDKAFSNPEWFTAIYKASETDVIPEEELASMKADMDPEEYSQELECSFTAAVKGAYYTTILEEAEASGRIGKYVYDTAYPVDTYWDLGIGDGTAIWYRQKLPNGYRYIDYDEFTGMSLIEISKKVKEKEYSYGRHVLPWDGKARDLGTGVTRQELLRKQGLICEVQKRQAVDDRIQASRVCLRKSYFDRDSCEYGLKCLRSYQKEWNAKLRRFEKKPLHDWASHASDAYGYSALDDRDSHFTEGWYDELPTMAESDYNELGDY